MKNRIVIIAVITALILTAGIVAASLLSRKQAEPSLAVDGALDSVNKNASENYLPESAGTAAETDVLTDNGGIDAAKTEAESEYGGEWTPLPIDKLLELLNPGGGYAAQVSQPQKLP